MCVLSGNGDVPATLPDVASVTGSVSHEGAPERGFPVAEFTHRLARAQRAMAADDIDLLLLTREADVRWFSGFLTRFWQSPTRPWFLLVPASGAPVAVIPGIGEACMARTWVRDIRTWSSPDPGDDGVSLLVATIVELAGRGAATGGTGRVRIGLPKGAGTHLRMPLADLERVAAALPGCRWHDATRTVNALRAIKSDAEIAKIRHVCRAASRAFAAVPELVVSGMTDVDAFRAFKVRCLEEGVDDVDYLVGAAGPGGYGDIISPPSGRALRRGDVLILDTGCTFDGHFCDFDRNWAIGEADAAAKAAYRVAWEATEAGLSAAGPGVRCHELFAAMGRVMAPHSIDAAGARGANGSDTGGESASGAAGRGGVGRSGHGLGTELTEPPSLMPGDDTELLPGMVITLEPGFAFAPGKMMVHEENIVITEEGCELLSVRAPSELPVIGGH